MRPAYGRLLYIYRYYSVLGTTGVSVFGVTLNSWSAFLDTCEGIMDEHLAIKDTDTIFIGAKLIDKDSPVRTQVKVRNENALIRFQFLEALLRIADTKYLR